MTQSAKVQDPSMEEILASIRRIIADDDATRIPGRFGAHPSRDVAPSRDSALSRDVADHASLAYQTPRPAASLRTTGPAAPDAGGFPQHIRDEPPAYAPAVPAEQREQNPLPADLEFSGPVDDDAESEVAAETEFDANADADGDSDGEFEAELATLSDVEPPPPPPPPPTPEAVTVTEPKVPPEHHIGANLKAASELRTGAESTTSSVTTMSSESKPAPGLSSDILNLAEEMGRLHKTTTPQSAQPQPRPVMNPQASPRATAYEPYGQQPPARSAERPASRPAEQAPAVGAESHEPSGTIDEARRNFVEDRRGGPLVSPRTSEAVDTAFNSLATTVLGQNSRTLEDLVREMLRPMLKAWLDDNLPSMVERLVKAEIERVSRGQS